MKSIKNNYLNLVKKSQRKKIICDIKNIKGEE